MSITLRMTRPIMCTGVIILVTTTIPGQQLIISTWDTTPTHFSCITMAILTGTLVTRHGTIHLAITAIICRCTQATILTIPAGVLIMAIARSMLIVIAGKTTTVMMNRIAW